MSNKQATSNPIASLPKVSMFDKKGQANLSKFSKPVNMAQKSERISIPTVRINQHKGA